MLLFLSAHTNHSVVFNDKVFSVHIEMRFTHIDKDVEYLCSW